MRALLATTLAATALAATSACLRHAEFQCLRDGECGTGGVCESVGYCSVPDPACGTGRSFSDSAGLGLSNTCVPAGDPGPGPGSGPGPGAGPDAGLADAPIDGAPCPGFAPIAGSAHTYKALANVSWDEAVNQCGAGGAAYLAVPDDATELGNLATLVAAPLWVGIDDKENHGTFVTQKGLPASFLPWAEDQPDQDPPAKECVEAVSSTQIATGRCGTKRTAVCECEP